MKPSPIGTERFQVSLIQIVNRICLSTPLFPTKGKGQTDHKSPLIFKGDAYREFSAILNLVHQTIDKFDDTLKV